jgi:hypothetical protein
MSIMVTPGADFVPPKLAEVVGDLDEGMANATKPEDADRCMIIGWYALNPYLVEKIKPKYAEKVMNPAWYALNPCLSDDIKPNFAEKGKIMDMEKKMTIAWHAVNPYLREEIRP